jgi:iron complex transport system substrate-binding protein
MVNWDDRLMHLKSVKNGNVYHFMKRSKTNGGIGISDFYESAVAHPDIILADVISIVHPQLLPSYESVYANKCEEGER